MKTTAKHFGKYEGNYSQLTARVAHEASLDGADRECGDVDALGWFASLVVGKRYTFLIVEDNGGFVDVEVFTNGEPAIETNWNAYLKMEEEAYEAQEDDK